MPEDGLAVICADDPVIREILPQISRPILTYGFNETDQVQVLEYQQQGVYCRMKVKRPNKPILNVTLNLRGGIMY